MLKANYFQMYKLPWKYETQEHLSNGKTVIVSIEQFI